MLCKVKVFPCAKKEEVLRTAEDSFEVKVKEKPEKGMANKAVLRALSSFLGLPLKKARIIKGFRRKNKIIEINEL